MTRRTFAAALAAAAALLAAPAALADSPMITGASGSAVSATASSIDVQIGSAATAADYRVCALLLGGQTFGLGAGQGSWQGGDTIAPGQTLTAQLAITDGPDCSTPLNSSSSCQPLCYSNTVTFTVPAYQAPPPPAAPVTAGPGAPAAPAGSAAPVASMTVAANGLTLDFTDNSAATGGTITAISWLFGDGANAVSLPGETVSHTYAAAGDYVVVQIVTDSNGLASQASYTIGVRVLASHRLRKPKPAAKHASKAHHAAASRGRGRAVAE